MSDYDAYRDEYWLSPGTYYVVTQDWPLDRLEVITVPVVAEVEITERCLAEQLRYRVLRLWRHDGDMMSEQERADYEATPDWLDVGDVYETLSEALCTASGYAECAA